MILFDTVALLRWLRGPAHLGPAVQAALQTQTLPTPLHVSIASIWEVAIKAATGKLPTPADFLTRVQGFPEFMLLSIKPAHAWRVRSLPIFRDHKDPFDRMLIAQALEENLTIATSDPAFQRYGVKTIW